MEGYWPNWILLQDNFATWIYSIREQDQYEMLWFPLVDLVYNLYVFLMSFPSLTWGFTASKALWVSDANKSLTQ